MGVLKVVKWVVGVLAIAAVVVAGVVVYSVLPQRLAASLQPPLKDASIRVERVIAILGSGGEPGIMSSILERLESDRAAIESQIPDLLVLEKRHPNSEAQAVLQHLRACRSYLEATSAYLKAGVVMLMGVDEAKAAAGRLEALKRAHPDAPDFSKATLEEMKAYGRAFDESKKLSTSGLDAVVRSYEAASKMKDAAGEQAKALRQLQAIRLTLAKRFPADVLIPDETLATAASTTEVISGKKLEGG